MKLYLKSYRIHKLINIKHFCSFHLVAAKDISFKFNLFTLSLFLYRNVVEIRMKSAAAGKTRFFDPPRMIFAA
jgi:hypothetical protein